MKQLSVWHLWNIKLKIEKQTFWKSHGELIFHLFFNMNASFNEDENAVYFSLSFSHTVCLFTAYAAAHSDSYLK